jgi:hypothetical protein
VRCLRLGQDIRPYQGAQGFRVGPSYRKIRARVTAAEMFHYGWARPAKAINEKYEASKVIYPWRRDRTARDQARGYLEWIPLLQPFRGTHPRAARDWISTRLHDADRVIGPRRLRPSHLRFYLSDWIERLTGARIFEFRNYHLV